MVQHISHDLYDPIDNSLDLSPNPVPYACTEPLLRFMYCISTSPSCEGRTVDYSYEIKRITH